MENRAEKTNFSRFFLDVPALFILQSLIVVFCSGSSLAEGSSCPHQFNQIRSCYCVSTQSLSWYSARAACVNISGELAVLDSESKNRVIDEELFLNDRSYWIGLYFNSTKWFWINGDTANYTHWKEGEPNDFENNFEGCGEYNIVGNEKGWNDEQCQRKRKFICDMRANASYNISGKKEFSEERRANVTFQVKAPPIIKNVLPIPVDNEILRELGQQVSLLCDAESTRRVLNYTWLKDGAPLTKNSSAVVVISLETEEDFGYYECEVRERGAGVARKMINVRRKVEGNTLSLPEERELFRLYCTIGVLSASVLSLLLVIITRAARRYYLSCRESLLHSREGKKSQRISYSLPSTIDRQPNNADKAIVAPTYSEPNLPVGRVSFKTDLYEDLRSVEERNYHSLEPSTLSKKEGDFENVADDLTTPVQTYNYEIVIQQQKTEEEPYLDLIA